MCIVLGVFLPTSPSKRAPAYTNQEPTKRGHATNSNPDEKSPSPGVLNISLYSEEKEGKDDNDPST